MARKEYDRLYRAANREKRRLQAKEWHRNNPDHRDKNVDSYRASDRLWASKNKGQINAKTAKRRAAKLERTPPWLTGQHLADIQSFYDWADYLEGPHEVDHVVPLQGKLVSGLHVPWNLEVLSKADHAGKGNRYDV